MPFSTGSVPKWKTPSTKGNGFRFGRIKAKIMGTDQVIVRGILAPDGRLELDSPPNLPAGPVEVVLRSLTACPQQGRLVAILAASQGRVGSCGWALSNNREKSRTSGKIFVAAMTGSRRYTDRSRDRAGTERPKHERVYGQRPSDAI